MAARAPRARAGVPDLYPPERFAARLRNLRVLRWGRARFTSFVIRPSPAEASRTGGFHYSSNEISDAFGFLPGVLDLTCLARQVSIDVGPRDEANRVNLRRHTKVTVAVLGSPEHDPASLDPASVRSGATGTEASPAQTAMEDADRGGDVDLVLRFRI